jgi:excisionase family DNA binding protein
VKERLVWEGVRQLCPSEMTEHLKGMEGHSYSLMFLGRVMNRLLTPKELSEFLNVKLSTIYAWSCQEFLPIRKVGRLLRFDEQDIERWLAGRACGGRITKKVKLPLHIYRKHDTKKNPTKTEDENERDQYQTERNG